MIEEIEELLDKGYIEASLLEEEVGDCDSSDSTYSGTTDEIPATSRKELERNRERKKSREYWGGIERYPTGGFR